MICPNTANTRGAKAAMTLALKSPDHVQDIIAVDNAPVDAVLESSFAKYIHALKKIEAANVTRQAEAVEILREYESVRSSPTGRWPTTDTSLTSPYPSSTFFLATYIGLSPANRSSNFVCHLTSSVGL